MLQSSTNTGVSCLELVEGYLQTTCCLPLGCRANEEEDYTNYVTPLAYPLTFPH